MELLVIGSWAKSGWPSLVTILFAAKWLLGPKASVLRDEGYYPEYWSNRAKAGLWRSTADQSISRLNKLGDNDFRR